MMAQYAICTSINDIRDAAKIAGNFFLTVLKTPDFTCAVADPAKPNEIIDTKLMKDIFDDLRFDLNYVPSSCFDPVVQAELASNTETDPETGESVEAPRIAVAESGLFFNDIKDPDPRFPFTNDLGVRGIWSDKLLAVKYLTTRKGKAGVTEDDQSSMIDHSEIRKDFVSYVQHLTMKTELSNPVPFQTQQGDLVSMPYEIDSSYVIPTQPNYTGSPYFMMIKFDLPENADQDFSKKVLEQFVRYNATQDPKYRDNARAVVNALTILKRDVGTEVTDPSVSSVNLNGYTFLATKENALGKILIDSIQSLQVLEQIGKETAAKVLKARTELPEGLSEDEKLVAETFTADQIEQLKALIENLPPGGEIPAAIQAAINLGQEGLTKVGEALAQMSTPPAGATQGEQMLYMVPLEALTAYTSGELEKQVTEYKGVLDLVPFRGKKSNFDFEGLFPSLVL
jgi:hypothetical protein